MLTFRSIIFTIFWDKSHNDTNRDSNFFAIKTQQDHGKECSKGKQNEADNVDCPNHFHFRATLDSMILIKLINYLTVCVLFLLFRFEHFRSLIQPFRWWMVENSNQLQFVNVFSPVFWPANFRTFPGGFSEKHKKNCHFKLHRNAVVVRWCMSDRLWGERGWGSVEKHRKPEGNKINVRQLKRNRFFVSEPEHTLKTVKTPRATSMINSHISSTKHPRRMTTHLNYSCRKYSARKILCTLVLW